MNLTVKMMVKVQETLALKWVHLLIKAAVKGEQMKDLQTENSKATTMQNHLELIFQGKGSGVEIIPRN